MPGYRYGPYAGGPDPLEPPYDVRGAVDALGESVLDGTDAASALRDLLRRGLSGHRGLDDLLRRVRERQREIRSRGRLDGILLAVSGGFRGHFAPAPRCRTNWPHAPLR